MRQVPSPEREFSWLRSLGANQEELAAVEGIGFVVARTEIDFKAGARLDDLLAVTVKMVEKKKTNLWQPVPADFAARIAA